MFSLQNMNKSRIRLIISRLVEQFYSQPSSQQHSTVVPPRMHQTHPQQQQQQQQQASPSPQQPAQQDIASNRPKRYSSLRQRPAIAEGPPAPAQPNYQPPPPQHTYYPPPPQGIVWTGIQLYFLKLFNSILLTAATLFFIIFGNYIRCLNFFYCFLLYQRQRMLV